jgi:NAD(P)H-dependent flavin oxidoreductase YrpB (nitropropane dioxygenase family)
MKPVPYPVQRALLVPVRAAAEASGDAAQMQTWAGQGAALSRSEPADALVRRLWKRRRCYREPRRPHYAGLWR